MTIKFYNTMERRKVEFQPIDEGSVRMYTCGPTVYDYAHIGNFRTYIFEDLLRRYLKFRGFEVKQVMNLTDVDDKTIKNSIKEGKELSEYTKKFKEAFFDDLDTLGIERAEVYPAATEHIDAMVEMVKKLIDKGLAYKGNDGTWYFSISKFKDYGKLANMNPEDLKTGVRIASDEYEKDEARDFALWKAWNKDDGDVYWETELGKGRPGWHIECSAMSTQYLGNHFDIHTGGVDNMFPHHENEIAQAEGANDEKFVNYWLHSEFLVVEGQKMSKSLGNFYTLRQILDKGYHPMAVRYVLISTHYRKKLNFTIDGLNAAATSLQRIWDFYRMLEKPEKEEAVERPEVGEILKRTLDGFTEDLDNDLNISGAIGKIFDMIRELNRINDDFGLAMIDKKRIKELLDKFDTVLGFVQPPIEKDMPILEFEGQKTPLDELIGLRERAKSEKNWTLADKLRDFIEMSGYVLEDTREGTEWKRKI
ncbi:MAG: cysteine--tRNA ligase [Candidatus Zixiibacteriota bacterium]